MIDAAPAYSTFAGILGGFLFLGIVTLMTGHKASDPSDRAPDDRDRALMLFLPAFLSLLLSSFLFGQVSGEQTCSRGYVEGIFATSLLGIGGLGIFSGISWMLDVYGARNNKDLGSTAVVFTIISFFVVAALLTDSGIAVIENSYNNNAPWYVTSPVIAYGPLLLTSVGISRKWFMPKENQRDKAERAAVYFPAGYVIMAILLYSVLSTHGLTDWPKRTLDDWKTYLALSVSLVFPAATIVVYARALPARVSRKVKVTWRQKLANRKQSAIEEQPTPEGVITVAQAATSATNPDATGTDTGSPAGDDRRS